MEELKELMEEPGLPEPPKPVREDRLLGLATAALLLGAIGLLGCYGMLFLNPRSGLNPFPPPTRPAPFQLPTPTNTSEFPTLPPAWTATPSRTPLPSRPPSETPAASRLPDATPQPR